MDLYEYQARQLLEEQDIPTPDAIFAQNSHEVAEAADKIGYPCVIKAQVKIGHRGQAGGVKIAHNRDEAILESESILPMTIHGHKVSGVLVAEAKNILHEYYVSISVDRTSRDFDVLATANGGTEVEEIAKEHPEAVKRLHIDALGDFDLAAATEMAQSIGFYHADVDQAAQILLKMWRCFKDNDATLVEINPLAKIGDPDDESTKQLSALDAKISLDDNASFRHDGWARFVDPIVPDPFEQRAREHGLRCDRQRCRTRHEFPGCRLRRWRGTGHQHQARQLPGHRRRRLRSRHGRKPGDRTVRPSGRIRVHQCLWRHHLLRGSRQRHPRSGRQARRFQADRCALRWQRRRRGSETMEGAAAKAAQLAGEATQSKEVR